MSTYAIQSGDTFSSIATKNETTIAALEEANPSVKPTDLQVGQVINLCIEKITIYTIKAGDTLGKIAGNFGSEISTIEKANPGLVPTDLQIGAQIKIPSSSSKEPPPTSLPTPPHLPAPPQAAKHTIQSGDTFAAIAKNHGTTPEAIEEANPGTNPTALQIGQVINLPNTNTHAPIHRVIHTGTFEGCEIGHGYKHYSGPSHNYPPPHLWAPYSVLWSQNSPLMSLHNTPHQVHLINLSIHQAARETGLDPRTILCLIMQESGGNVHVGTTFNGVTNTGLMQAYDGVSFDSGDEEGSILQMIRDGAGGSRNGPGLRQAWEGNRGDYFVAFRVYNSGNANHGDLNDARGATEGYVRDMGNRLMGHVWAGM